MAAAPQKITFTHRSSGVLTDVNTIKLSDPTGLYGVKRVDTGAIVVPDGKDILRESLGVYSFTLLPTVTVDQLLPLVPDVEYEYWIEWTYNGGTRWQDRLFTAKDAVTTATNPYTTWERFKRKWGEKNITTASNKDGKALTPDFEVVQDAFDHATDEIHDSLRGGVVAVPLDFTAYSDDIPACVREWVHVLAYAHMYDSRGFEDTNKFVNKLAKMVMNIYAEINFVKLGIRQLNAAPATDSLGNVSTVGGSHVDVTGRCWRYVDGQLVCT